MSQELQELQNLLFEVYQKNLQFLKTNFFDIYQLVEELSNNIANGTYQEKYSLEMMDSYFDIKNLENNGFYYASNSYLDAEGRAEHNNFTDDSSWDLLRKSMDNKLIKSNDFKDVLPIVDYINEKVDLSSIEFREIFKMVFIGTGLGLHINEIYKKLNPKTILIIEPEVEIFRLSLFTIDYRAFIGDNKELFLSVGENKQKRLKVYENFNAYQEFMNFNVKHYTLLGNYDYIKEEITTYFSRSAAFGFPYKLVLENLHKTIDLMKHKNKFLNQGLLNQKKILKGKKVLLISAGPSVDKYMDFIKKYQNKFIIICVDVIVRKLEKNGIVPDIVVSIDPSPRCGDYLTTDDPEYLKNSAIILMSQQDGYTLKVVKNLHSYFSQSVPIIDELGYLGSIPNVGTFSFSITCFLGAEEIYLIGNDAAFNQETGERYSKDASYYVKDNLGEISSSENTVSNHDIIEVKGNLRDIVKTNRELYAFKDDYEVFLRSSNFKELEQKCTIYNLSDGVYIEGMVPLTKKELLQQIQTNKKLDKKIIQNMDTIAQTIDSFDFDGDIKIINGVLNKVSKFKKLTYKNRDDFLRNKLDIMIWVLEQTKHCGNGVVPNLFLRFTALADIYVNFVLNLRQKDLHSKEEINTLSKMWLDGLYNLFKDIKSALKV